MPRRNAGVITKSSSGAGLEIWPGTEGLRRGHARSCRQGQSCEMATAVRITSPITSLVLEEFRLRSPDFGPAAARIAASFSGVEPTVPLLTSIDDPHDVAAVWALHSDEETGAVAAQRDKLDHLVASWRPLKHYEPRITERSQGPPAHYRLAVTESGINAMGSQVQAATPRTLSAVSTM